MALPGKRSWLHTFDHLLCSNRGYPVWIPACCYPCGLRQERKPSGSELHCEALPYDCKRYPGYGTASDHLLCCICIG